ncbi:MAG: leucine-rich repeat protein, partial [Holosporales bacterium]
FIMTFSRITRTLGFITLLGSCLSPVQATEVPDLEDLSAQSTRFDDLPEDAVLQVMTFLPDHDTARLGLTSKALNATSTKALRAMIHGMTLNRGVGEDDKRLQDLPTLRGQQILGEIAQEDQYLAVPMNSDLCTMMPETLKLADLDDWRQNLALAMPLYEAAFGKEWPKNHVHLALQHLLAVIDTRVYVQGGNINQSFASFATKKAQSLIQSLQNQRQAHPFVNFLHGDIDATRLTTQAHTIVLSDAELNQPETKQKLEKLLEMQTADHTHHVVLSVGNTPARLEDGILTLRTDDLPSNVRHLTVTNPSANVTAIGDEFLQSDLLAQNATVLTKLWLAGFQNVHSIGANFLLGCSGLTSLDLSSLRNVTQIGHSFLTWCSGLTSVDLSAFRNVTQIGHSFLSGCSGLKSVDLSAFKYVTAIDGNFLWGCSNLTSVGLSAFRNVTVIGELFLSGCSGLTSVDLSAFRNLTTIGGDFLYGCSGLTSVDLSPFKNVTEIGEGFLSHCSGLTSVDLSDLTNVKIINPSFITGCPDLTTETKAHISAFCKQRGVEWKPE